MQSGTTYATFEVKFVFKHLHSLGTKKKSASVRGCHGQMPPKDASGITSVLILTAVLSMPVAVMS